MSSIELVLYMPLLMTAILMTVQFSLVYLGNQAASASAREAARVARVTGDATQGQAKGESLARDLGRGVLDDVDVQVVQIDGDRMRATVSGRAPGILPFLTPPRVSDSVQGPIEQFVQDAP
ncbi:TadE/TadG family type IV pilus assembly protein [Aeromicrobium marinum]|uniref:TadE/TadG family type IV pilus assembly protein n=1 Tax=Aeromicrobium marinum TaxID=219314 RepID=UPI001FE11FF1|nr:TadE/TadG family type IV pilus assembly protein [Aeromicrobium marinum]